MLEYYRDKGRRAGVELGGDDNASIQTTACAWMEV